MGDEQFQRHTAATIFRSRASRVTRLERLVPIVIIEISLNNLYWLCVTGPPVGGRLVRAHRSKILGWVVALRRARERAVLPIPRRGRKAVLYRRPEDAGVTEPRSLQLVRPRNTRGPGLPPLSLFLSYTYLFIHMYMYNYVCTYMYVDACL